MTRIFNFAILLLIGGIYYVQNDGFSTANATVDVSAEPVIEQTAAIETPDVVVPVKAVVEQVATQTQIITNTLTKGELASIEDRFMAQRLVASTVIVPFKATTTATAQIEAEPNKDYLLVAGNLVNAREEPTTSSNVLAKLRRGTQVEPTGLSDGAWAQVIVMETGQSVWMHSDFLTNQS